MLSHPGIHALLYLYKHKYITGRFHASIAFNKYVDFTPSWLDTKSAMDISMLKIPKFS